MLCIYTYFTDNLFTFFLNIPKNLMNIPFKIEKQIKDRLKHMSLSKVFNFSIKEFKLSIYQNITKILHIKHLKKFYLKF